MSHVTNIGSLCINTVNNAFLPILFAGYSVNTAKYSFAKKSFYNNFCDGFKGAFVAQCLANFVPIVAQSAKSLITRSISLNNRFLLVQLAKLMITSYKVLTKTFSYPIINSCILAFVVLVIVYKKSLQMSIAIIFSGISAKFIIDCLNNNLSPSIVNLIYLFNFIYILKLIYSHCIKIKDVKFQGSFLEEKMLNLCETIYNSQLKRKNNPLPKEKAIMAILEARKNDQSFKQQTDAFIYSNIRKQIGIGNVTQNDSQTNQESSDVHEQFIVGSQIHPKDLSDRKIIDFMASQPTKQAMMDFCEKIYKAKINNKKQKSLMEQFSLAIMKYRNRNDKSEFKSATNPYFEEIFYKKIRKVTGISREEINQFMESKPTKKELMAFAEKVFATKIQNSDKKTWKSHLISIGVALRDYSLIRGVTDFVGFESYFNDLVCEKIYSFMNQG